MPRPWIGTVSRPPSSCYFSVTVDNRRGRFRARSHTDRVQAPRRVGKIVRMSAQATTAAPSGPAGPGGPDLSAFADADERRRAGLRRMKLVATGLLMVAAVVYAVTVGQDGALGFVNTGAEAAMVGALADWFAVTALFRHPLGLPIPHTALIPNRKDALGRSLEEFVATNFLSEDVVRDKLVRARVSHRIGEWLADPAHAARAAAEAATVAGGALRVLKDDDVVAVLEQVVVQRVAATPWSPVAGQVLAGIVAEKTHHRFVDLVVDEAHRWLRANQDTVIRLVTDQAPDWTPQWLDERVGHRVYREVERWVEEVRDDPEHRARVALDGMLSRFADDLQHDETTRARAEAVKERLLAHPELRRATVAVWWTVRRLLEEAIADPDGELRRRVAGGLAELGERLRDDDTLQGRVDRYVQDGVGYVVRTYAGEVATVISDTVERWDAQDASRRIELHVGRDLQFIRINGTVVGALAGLVIHTVTVLVR
jgi:uncharacterized membrane-anchored protein YjiN (DUF445 family)